MLSEPSPYVENRIACDLLIEGLFSISEEPELEQIIECLCGTKIAPLWRYMQSEIRL